MSSGACRALVSLLLTLVATVVMTLPVAANTDRLNESSTITYTVVPASGEINVRMVFRLETKGTEPFEPQEWGPIMVEERARPSVSSGFELITPAQDAPGLWKSVEVLTPRIDGGKKSVPLVLRYRIDASLGQEGAILGETPARVDSSYFYFCALGQDTDRGAVKIDVEDDAAWTITQSGTPLKKSHTNGLESGLSRAPADIFTCVEGVREDRLAPDSFVGPAGRPVVLQAWMDKDNWLPPAKATSAKALDAIHRFLGHDIPGEGPVIIRMAPPRELGGYASAHDTPGIVQLDEDGGVVDPEHELAHAWFTTDTFSELWLREGMALWTASAMSGEACAPAGPNSSGLELSDWQVVRPTSGEGWEQELADQDAAACGIVSAVAARMSEETWREVIGALLDIETKYVGAAGPETASSPTVDYREWLDAVDERGLVPAAADPAFAGNLDDLDFAQDLLDDFGIIPSGPELAERSAARAYYHQFLAEAAAEGLGAPLAVRKAMDDWLFGDATEALDVSYEVLRALKEADELLPTAGLIPLMQRDFESAASVEEVENVRTDAFDLLEEAGELFEPLGQLEEALPPTWDRPAAIVAAIDGRRFDEAMAAITPALQVARDITAADAALPAAGLVELYGPRYRSSATQSQLEDLAAEVVGVRREAVATGQALELLRTEVGEWQIPAAVTDPIDNGQISAGRAVIGDARGVVAAARAADIALPEAQLSTDIRPRFESVATAAEMTALRTEAESRRDEATAVGSALKLLNDRVPDWQIPAVVTDPIEARDFAAASLSAAAAQRWVENAWQADQDWEEFRALDRARDGFENAQTLEDLVKGADLAEKWSQAAEWIDRAEVAVTANRDLLTEFGLWGVDVNTPLEQAKEAAFLGELDTAINKSSEVVSLIGNGASSGGLRLAGIVFFGVAVLGVLGLWVILRRQSGPPWARQTKPHWMKKNGDGPKQISGPKRINRPRK